jgi:hypothetical protein
MGVDSLNLVHRILDDQSKLLERADQKAIAFISTIGIFAAFFLTFIKDIPINMLTLILITFYILSVLLAISQSILAINPRIVRSNNKTERPTGVTFFADVVKYKSLREYRQRLEEIISNDPALMDEYTEQVRNLSFINAKKHVYLQRTAWFFLTALISELIIVILALVYVNHP